MATLKARVEALEAVSGHGESKMIVFRRIIDPKHPGEVLVGWVGGKSYRRQPQETEDEFRGRLGIMASESREAGATPAHVILTPYEGDL